MAESLSVKNIHLGIWKSALESAKFRSIFNTQNENQRHILGQVWSAEELNAFASKDYVAPQVPLVLPKVHAITALYMQNRLEIATKPAEKYDSQYSEITNAILKYIQNNEDYDSKDIKQFEDGIQCLVGAIELNVEEDKKDPFSKNITFRTVPSGYVFWDVQATNPDQSDMNYYGYWDWVDYDSAIATYPEYKKEIEETYSQLDYSSAQMQGGNFWKNIYSSYIQNWLNGSMAKTVTDLVDVDGRRLRKVVLYQKKYRKVYYLKTKIKEIKPRMMPTNVQNMDGETLTQGTMPVTDQSGQDIVDYDIREIVEKYDSNEKRKEGIAEATKLAEQNSEINAVAYEIQFQTAETNECYWKKTVTLGNILVSEEDIYFEGNRLLLYFPKFVSGYPLSPLVSGVEIEKQVNRWWTFVDQAMWKSWKNPTFVDKSYYTDTQDLANRATTHGAMFEYDSGKDPNFDIRKAVYVAPTTPVNPQIFDQINNTLTMLDDVFAVPDVRMGKQQFSNTPARSLELQDQNAQAIQTPWFEPMKTTKLNLAKTMIEAIPHVYTEQQIKKIVGIDLEEFVTVDYLKWLMEARYNLVVVNQAKTDTQMEKEFNLLSMLRERDPLFAQMSATNPEFVKVIIESSPISAKTKESLLSMIDQAIMSSQLEPQTPQGQGISQPNTGAEA